MTNHPGDQLTYNGENHLVEASVGGVATTYVYDGDAQQVLVKNGAEGTIYIGKHFEVRISPSIQPPTLPPPPANPCLSGSVTCFYLPVTPNGVTVADPPAQREWRSYYYAGTTRIALRVQKEVWQDTAKRFGSNSGAYLPDPLYPNIELFWGVGDRYIVAHGTAAPNENRLLVYDTQANVAYEGIGTCNLIVRDEESRALQIWCEIQKEGEDTYIVLHPDGLRMKDGPPTLVVGRAQVWRFSPDGSRVLFAGEDGIVRIADQGDAMMELPLKLNFGRIPYAGPADLNFSWTPDGSRILVMGEETGSELCPRIRVLNSPMGENSLIRTKCWYVLDAQTGEFLWWPNEDFAKSIGENPEDVSCLWNAALSPDGEWLALTWNCVPTSCDVLAVVSLKTGKAQLIFDDRFYQLVWVDK